mmetsp:Transcript_31445/g.53646  ORF Transcript_31445/g.53646 Transcript_31445/m.53646 type:complete len:221 (+) Transcript_31445:95-757(+)
MAEESEVACLDEATPFTSVLDCVFIGNAAELTEAELNLTVRGVKSNYNKLQSAPNSVCDQLFRAITSVSLPEMLPPAGSMSSAQEEFVLRYEVSGQCRGCPDDTVLFEDSINRDNRPGRMLTGQSYSPSLSFFMEDRNLQTTSCTCPAGAEIGGPVMIDFIDGYNKWIENKTEEGEMFNLKQLLRLSEPSPNPKSGAQISVPNHFGSALLVALVLCRKIF